MVIDGTGQTSEAGRWSTFIGVSKLYASVGQHEATAEWAAGKKDKDTGLWLFLSGYDRVADTANMRLFPFDTSGASSNGETT